MDEFGLDWTGCYLIFNSPSWKQVRELPKDDTAAVAGIDLLKSLFLSGLGFDGKEKVTIEMDDLESLPLPILSKCIAEIAGALSPKENES